MVATFQMEKLGLRGAGRLKPGLHCWAEAGRDFHTRLDASFALFLSQHTAVSL